MFTTDGPALNDIPMQYFEEIKYQQPLLGHGNGAQGINGTLANFQFAGQPGFIETNEAHAGRIAGANPFEALADMKLAAYTIREPSYIPTGLHNAVYAEIYEGAL